MIPVIIILIVAAVIALIIIGAVQAARRRKELAEWSRAQGFSFSPDSDYGMDSRYPDFSCLHEGSSRYAYNVIEGEQKDRPICAFDYHYETYSADSKGNRQTHHHYFSAVIVDTELRLRPLFIRAEGFFDKVAEFFGFDDIDFESAEFSRKFCVKSKDRKWAYDVLHQETMEFLLNSPRFTLDFQGSHILAYDGSEFSPATFVAALDVIHGIVDRFPDYLLRDLKGAH